VCLRVVVLDVLGALVTLATFAPVAGLAMPTEETAGVSVAVAGLVTGIAALDPARPEELVAVLTPDGAAFALLGVRPMVPLVFGVVLVTVAGTASALASSPINTGAELCPELRLVFTAPRLLRTGGACDVTCPVAAAAAGLACPGSADPRTFVLNCARFLAAVAASVVDALVIGTSAR
jgi:hypothetical protein